MSGRVITITSGKGGVGKTTTTANLGTALASQGKKVAVVDADIGLRNLDVVMGLENRIVFDLVDVVEGRARLKQALIKDKRFPDLCLLPAAQTRDKNAVSPEQMADLAAQLSQDFDFVLIDSPAGIEQGFRNAIAGAHQVLLVTVPEVSSVRDADRIIDLVEASQLPTPQLIVNRIKPAMVKRGDMMSVSDVTDILAVQVIGIVPEDELVVVSTNRGEAVIFDEHSKAGRAFHNISRRLVGETVPFISLEEPVKSGWFNKIFAQNAGKTR